MLSPRVLWTLPRPILALCFSHFSGCLPGRLSALEHPRLDLWLRSRLIFERDAPATRKFITRGRAALHTMQKKLFVHSSNIETLEL